jgi:hypothetical protein
MVRLHSGPTEYLIDEEDENMDYISNTFNTDCTTIKEVLGEAWLFDGDAQASSSS